MAQEKEDITLNSESLDGEILPQKLQEKMKRFLEQQKQIELFTADIDLLQKRFEVEKSLFGRVATSYSSLSWWQKGLIFIVVGGLFALIGLTMSIVAAIVLPIIALSLYLTLTYLFEEYAESDINRFDQLSSGLLQRETEMKASVLELQQTENEIYELIEQVKKFGGNYAEIIDKYNEQAQSFADLVRRYEETVSQFEQLKTEFRARADDMKTVDSEFSEGLQQIGVQLYQQFARIKQNTDDIEQTSQRLSEGVDSLKEEISSLTAEGHQPISGRFDELLADLPFQSEEDLSLEQERSMKHDALMQKTDDYLSDFDAFLSQHNATNQSNRVRAQNPEAENRMVLN